MYVYIKCPTLSPGCPRFSIWPRQERGLDRTPHAKTVWVPHESPPVRSLDLILTFTQRLMVGFLGESKNGFLISDHTDSSLPKKRKIRKRIICHDNGMSSCSSWEKKRTDTHRGKDKKKKHIFCIYFGLKHKRFSNRIHPLG